MQGIYEKLKQILLLGLQTVPADEELEGFCRVQGLTGSPEEQVLQALALLSLQARAQAPANRPVRAQPEGLPDEEFPYIAPRLDQALVLIASGRFGPAMYEWLTLVRTSGQIVPAWRLPLLLDYAEKHPWLKSQIIPLTGRRGDWALAHIAEWSARYRRIPDGEDKTFAPKERELFPLLHLKRPLDEIYMLASYLETPAGTWSTKLSARMRQFLTAALRQPVNDDRIRRVVAKVVDYASYAMVAAPDYTIHPDEVPETWHREVAAFNEVLDFRKRYVFN